MGKKNIVNRLRRLHKTRIDLAKESGYSVAYVRSTLNGKDKLPKPTEARFDDILRKWESEKAAGK